MSQEMIQYYRKLLEAQEASIDWLEVRCHSVAVYHHAALVAQKSVIPLLGNVSRETTYTKWGWTWRVNGPLRYGSKIDVKSIAVSGELAQVFWDNLQATNFFDNLPNEAKINRIDLAVDCLFKQPQNGIIQRIWQRRQEEEGVPVEGSMRLISDIDGNGTIYSGKRGNRHYGRLYDKGLEQGARPGLWLRYEVEVKDIEHSRLGQTLAASNDLSQTILDYVHWYFEQRGICSIPDGNGEFQYDYIKASVSGEVDSLSWVTKQVVPGLLNLISEGYGRQVIESLYGVVNYANAVERAFHLGRFDEERKTQYLSAVETLKNSAEVIQIQLDGLYEDR